MPYNREGAVIARMYDRDYAALRTPSGDVEFYVEEARRSGGPVLELGCGTGRMLVPTAEAGIGIVGLDASEPMLARAREKLAGRDLPAEVRLGDMREFDLAGRTFALVTIPFRAIAHVEEVDEQLSVFRHVRRHLAPEGRLVFDFYQPDPRFLAEPRPESLDIEREEQDGTKVRRFSSSHAHISRQISEITFRWEVERPDGGVEEFREEFPMRWYYRFEIEHLLARAGLRLESVWGEFDRSPLEDSSREMIFTARAET